MKRVKKNTKETKEAVVNVRCTESQKSMLEELATREGLGLSTWLLRLGLMEARAQQEKSAR